MVQKFAFNDVKLRSLTEGQYWDTKLPAFGLRVGKRASTFVLKKDNRRVLIRRHPQGDGVSVRYFKRVLWITEVNGRVSELRSKGYDIQSSSERDPYGFVYLRLVDER